MTRAPCTWCGRRTTGLDADGEPACREAHGCAREPLPQIARAEPLRPLRLTIGLETRTVAEWARRRGISAALLHNRLRLGWSVERATETPVRSRA